LSDLPGLIERCRAGDASAWEDVVRAQSGRVYNLCYRLTGRREDAEDLTQDVFIKAYRRLSQYDPARSSFPTWIAAIARHATVDHFRRTRDERRTQPLEPWTDADGSPRPGREPEDDAPSPDDVLAARETRRRVQAALDRLTPEFREAVILRDIQDLDYAEIASVLGLPVGTVKSRISRGRAELARLLSRIYEQVPSP
jgi:RNA polymerase sigma-70 factor (ECF subfamily)